MYCDFSRLCSQYIVFCCLQAFCFFYSEGSCVYTPPPVPLPLSLVNWAAAEVIKCKACTGKADIYSLCALIQEIYTGTCM